MQFEEIDSFFENQLKGISLSQLKTCIEDISNHYRENKFFIIKSKLYALSYALVRLPATRGALSYVLNQMPIPILENVSEIVDLGSGPGTLLSLTSLFPGLKSLQLVEKNPHFASFLKEIALGEEGVKLVEKDFLHLELENAPPKEGTRAVVASYSLGEIPKANFIPFLEKLSNGAVDLFIFVEPGTPRGFQTLNEVRRFFLKNTPHVPIAPCSHFEKCPLEGFGEEKWCHFSVRIERSKSHRFLKGGTLGYEDEKVSYLILAKSGSPNGKRILGTPKKSKAGILLELCAPNEVERLKILPSDPMFKKAKKLNWGDEYF